MTTRSLSVAARTNRRESEAPEGRPQEPTSDAAPIPSAPVVPAVLPPAPRKNSRKRIALFALLIVALGGGGYAYSQRNIESTDDAQIDADVVAISARTGGAVSAVHFEENQHVEAGQLLAELDDAPARARLAQADANLASAEAAAHAADAQAELAQRNAKGDLAVASAGLKSSTVGAQSTVAQIAEAEARVENAKAHLREAEQNLSRTETLFQSGAASNAQLDQMRSAHDVASTELTRAEAARATITLARDQAATRIAEAQAKLSQSDQVDALIRQATARAEQAHAAVATAKAQQELAAIDLSYTKIYAPNAGIVSKKNVNVGQIIAQGQSVGQLVPNTRWVTANFKETQLDQMHSGLPVTLSVDAYPGKELHGHVTSFSGATGSRFALLPPDNATGNYTKVVQRVSVRIQLDNVPTTIELRPGMSVEAHVDTSSKGK